MIDSTAETVRLRSGNHSQRFRDEPQVASALASTYAMVLAGGRGSRLNQLTEWRAKPAVSNPDQADSNSNGIGDACELVADGDGDGVEDGEDNCPAASNPLSMTPFTGSGGKVQGTEIEITLLPASLKSFQKDGAFRCPPLTNSKSYVPGRWRVKS